MNTHRSAEEKTAADLQKLPHCDYTATAELGFLHAKLYGDTYITLSASAVWVTAQWPL